MAMAGSARKGGRARFPFGGSNLFRGKISRERKSVFDQTVVARFAALQDEFDTKARELRRAIKSQIASGANDLPDAGVARLTTELRNIRARILRQERLLRQEIGISEADLRKIERLRDSQNSPKFDNRFWRAQIEDVPESEDLDSLLRNGFQQLIQLFDPKWLRAEACKGYRLGSSFLSTPLHLVNGVRMDLPGKHRIPSASLICCL